ncbi:MAG: hypothetical protein DRP83_00775 [Planctomycetota bacterium]|nr:MAG: hypothetical protein DRP83_00775 [Planctomycetota bacterium]
MNLEMVDAKIAEQQGVIIEAQARLEAWLEVREAFESTPKTSPKKVSKKKGGTLTEHIYAALLVMPNKFTSIDLVREVRKRMGGNTDGRGVSTSVCSFLHSTVTGKLKNPRVPLKSCGKREGRKLYTRK